MSCPHFSFTVNRKAAECNLCHRRLKVVYVQGRPWQRDPDTIYIRSRAEHVEAALVDDYQQDQDKDDASGVEYFE